jgi:hypothetical protein
MTAQAGLQASSWIGWMIAGAVFIIIIVSLFCLSKNFKRFIYGLPVIMIAYVIGWHSHKTGMAAARGDMAYLRWTLIVLVVALVSVLAGMLVERTAFMKQWEEIEQGRK